MEGSHDEKGPADRPLAPALDSAAGCGAGPDEKWAQKRSLDSRLEL